MGTTRRSLLAAGSGGALLSVPWAPWRGLRAQPAVARNARAIVGYAPGGPTDTVARLYAEAIRGAFAPAVVVENRPGAGGRLAVEAVKAAPADGTSFLVTPGSVVTLQPHVYPRQVRYDGLVDLIPVATMALFATGLAVPADHPARDLAGLVAWLRAQPPPVNYGSPAAGSGPQFIGGRLGQAVGVPLSHVPYRGAAPALQDLLAGRLPFMLAVLSDLVPQHGQGLRILALSAPRRIARLPDVPTFAEAGYPSLTSEDWVGAFLPAGTPEAVVAGLHRAIDAAAHRPDVRAGLERLEFQATVLDPATLARRIRQERDEWGPVVQASGFQPDD
ncbi:hypothetical protein LPC08_14245 [Roseomonas sp. OT10]|uniref:Bug family tripartite tricarboxylate transporter substrate binding protein n=1 Tax=Roseomonas cutis TaxID=2897332 RepID=UPI001E5EEAED|nr:tripartite tricarboxylate transporter substrate-binding protein [Roseomonas sp. OT10]UFN47188.1 hypothetical protein LPC08_14245 [Roseomonas sp. OT10]